MHEAGTVMWVTYVRSILCDNGFEQIWLFGCGVEKRRFYETKNVTLILAQNTNKQINHGCVITWIQVTAVIKRPLQELF